MDGLIGSWYAHCDGMYIGNGGITPSSWQMRRCQDAKTGIPRSIDKYSEKELQILASDQTYTMVELHIPALGTQHLVSLNLFHPYSGRWGQR